MPLIKLYNVSKQYDSKPVLRDVFFNINRGDRLVVVGPNGCGKTTLIKILAGCETSDSG
jgi:ABC-type Fe3+/spermidine/putrescine transport system ATPase subunit